MPMNILGVVIVSYGSYELDWRALGLSVSSGHPKYFKIIDQKLFDYAVIKHEIKYNVVYEESKPING
jgi:hypothetical protein